MPDCMCKAEIPGGRWKALSGSNCVGATSVRLMVLVSAAACWRYAGSGTKNCEQDLVTCSRQQSWVDRFEAN